MITINTSPASGSTAQDTLWHVVTSDNSGSVDMKYVFDVWVDGTQKIRVKQYPEPGNGRAYFDAGATVRNSMTYTWFEPVTNSAYSGEPKPDGSIAVVYALRIGEDVSGITTSNLASGEVSGFNWCPPLFQRKVVKLQDKLNKWFTNRELIPNVSIVNPGQITAYAGLGENLYLPYYTNQTSTLHCETFGFDNASLASATGAAKVIQNGFWQLNIGTTALATTLGLTFNTTVRYYEVWINSGDKVRVYLQCNPKFTPVLLHFVNRWGMYDTHRFDLVSKLNMAVTRKSFEQRDYRLNGTAVDYFSTSNRYYEGKINYLNSQMWTYKLTADALSDSDYEWLSDLIVSPQILLEQDSYFYPVTLKADNYEYSKYENNRLRALDLEVEMNQPRNSHLR